MRTTSFHSFRSIEVDHGEIVTAKLSDGDIFGEVSVLTGAPRGATCKAMKETACLVVGGPDLADIMAQGVHGEAVTNQKKKMVQIQWSSQVSSILHVWIFST